MTREEAIKEVRLVLERLKSNLHNAVWENSAREALEALIPELKESEDERIVKTLQEYVKSRNWNLGGPTQDEVLAWLEKQKVCLADNSRIRKELIFFLKEEIPQCSIKEHADKLKEFVSYLEKQKEQKPVEWSEEDEKMLDSVIRIITQFDDLAHEPTFAGPKWTHPYTKELNFLEKLRNRLFEEND
jgi:hypothetical protein